MQCISSCFFFYLGDWERMIKAQNFVKNINVLVSNCFIAGGLSGMTSEITSRVYCLHLHMHFVLVCYLFIYLFYIFISLAVWSCWLQIHLVPSPHRWRKRLFLLPGGLGMRLTTNYHTYPWKHNYIILKPHATVRQDLKVLIPVAQTWL